MSVPISFEDHDQPLVSLIIIAWRSAPHISACLESVAAHIQKTSYEVIVILNEPDEGLSEFIETETAGIHTIVTRVNVGYGGAVNLGVKRARGEYVVLLNDDAEIMEDWLEPLVDLARRRPLASAVGSTTLFPDGSIQEAGSVIWADGSTTKVGRNLPGGSRRYDYERRVDHCSGTSLLVRRSSWIAIGGMDADDYYPAYYEDTDFCLRLIEAGGQVWYQPRSYVRHLESASTNSSYRKFLFEKNQAVFVKRWSERLHSHVAFDPGDAQVIDKAVFRAMGSPVRVLAVVDSLAVEEGLFIALQADGRCQVAVYSERTGENNTKLCALGVGPVESGEQLSIRDHLEKSASLYDLVIDLRERESREYDAISTSYISTVTLMTLDSAVGDDVRVLVGETRNGATPERYLDRVALVERERESRTGQGGE